MTAITVRKLDTPTLITEQVRPLAEERVIVVEYVQQRLILGERATLREFRKWVRANLQI